MNPYIEKTRALEFLISEAPVTLSRDTFTLLPSQGVLVAGTVLSRVTASGKYQILAPAGSGGAEVARAILSVGVLDVAADQTITAIDCHAEVLLSLITFPAGITAPQTVTATANLAARFIKLRIPA